MVQQDGRLADCDKLGAESALTFVESLSTLTRFRTLQPKTLGLHSCISGQLYRK